MRVFGDSSCYAGSEFRRLHRANNFFAKPLKWVEEIWQKLALSDKYFIIPILLLFRSHVHGLSDVKFNGSGSRRSNELLLVLFLVCF